jgi:AraC-like DNA-binding protein
VKHDLLPQFHFNTDQLLPEQRFPVWRDALSFMFDVTLPAGADPKLFSAESNRWALGPCVVTEGKTTANHATRTPLQALSDGVDRYGLMLLCEGRWQCDLDGVIVSIGKDQPFMIDFNRPMTASSYDSSSFIMVHLSRMTLEDSLPHAFDAHGAVFGGSSGQLLSEHLHAVVRHLPSIAAAEANHVGNALCDLIAACLATAPGNEGSARPKIERALLVKARRYIDDHLHLKDLSHEQICRALSVSRSNLYRVFKSVGGVASYIHRRRLAVIHRALADPREHRRVSAIAAQFGFVNLAHFSRAFRREFGYSATAARLRVQNPHARSSGDVPQAYWDWVSRYDSG